MLGLSEIIKNYSSTHPKKTSTLPLLKKEENSKNESPIKQIKTKEIKEEEKKEDIKEQKKDLTSSKLIKDKAINILTNLIKSKNDTTLKEIYKSLETAKNFEMSNLKNPPKLDESLNILQNRNINKFKYGINMCTCFI